MLKSQCLKKMQWYLVNNYILMNDNGTSGNLYELPNILINDK